MSIRRTITRGDRQIETYVDGHWVQFTDVASGRRISGGISHALKDPTDEQLLEALEELKEIKARSAPPTFESRR